ncbi:acyl-CoA dehydrogenase family protein [Phycicoccus sp. DTK01]|uniref:acyl-CoA dehydrogenase family protein n=1 Tax=Phycicoccus sp. DTK01 TaxID=2785745 RepID=UPI001A903F4A|nr:acyl-CoA dehydrogenase family protein [Phycicoccus sp. DTK01]GIL34111.1 acyl-CoA dehydrogenase [Phycicoccus sp. DTK01]
MTPDLDPAHLELLERAEGLGRELLPQAAEADEADRFDAGIRAALASSGLVAYTVPGAFGGALPGVDPVSVALVREALAGHSAHADSMFAMQGIGSFALALGGSDAVRDAWLTRVATLDAVAALALTEPDVGSDLRALSTSLTVDGDELVVDGSKSFITNAPDADFFCVLAREADGLSLVFVPADLPGVTVTQPHQVISPHVLGDVVFDHVRVPLDHRIGAPGEGFGLVLRTLGTFRVSVGAAGVGIARAALAEALGYASERAIFGTTLARLGSVPGSLARCWVEIEASRSLVHRAASAAARDPLAALSLSSMAKVSGSETAGAVTDRCVQVMGRFGIVRGSRIERLYRAARPGRIYEGSTEVILDSLAKQLLREGAP